VDAESAVLFRCGDDELCGILHAPRNAGVDVGVLLVVGGPQYRVGSHRQFVILARSLAESGIAVLRFDYRGMGDSQGVAADFESIDDDIAAAADVLFDQCPHLRRMVLWGLCDAATANAFYAARSRDERLVGQVALNPWVRTVEGQAQAYVRHYYLKRLLSRGFWADLFGGKTDAVYAVKDFVKNWSASRRAGRAATEAGNKGALPERLCAAQTSFAGDTLVILSGQDLTAREFEARVAESTRWSDWLGSDRVTVNRLPDADHTFASRQWRDQVSLWTREWVLGLAEAGRR
jgi:uncharacterized protein